MTTTIRWLAVIALATSCNPQRKQTPTTPIIPAITRREVKPLAPRPEPVPLGAQTQGKLADPPTETPKIPPMNPGTNGLPAEPK